MTIFNNTPYKTKSLKGETLAPHHAQEAIEDILSDSSVFLRMPKVEQIVKVRCESVFGSHKLIITLAEGVPYPEYMLSARVAELAPKLINIFFETVGMSEEEEVFLQMQSYSANAALQSTNAAHNTAFENANTAQTQPIDASIISKTREELGLTYMDLAEAIGYEPSDLTKAISTGNMPKAMQKALELFRENRGLKAKLDELS